jgi:hypothetical protein
MHSTEFQQVICEGDIYSQVKEVMAAHSFNVRICVVGDCSLDVLAGPFPNCTQEDLHTFRMPDNEHYPFTKVYEHRDHLTYMLQPSNRHKATLETLAYAKKYKGEGGAFYNSTISLYASLSYF